MSMKIDTILKIVLLSAISLQTGCKFTPKVNTLEEINKTLDDGIATSIPAFEKESLPLVSEDVKAALVDEISGDFLATNSIKDRYFDINVNNQDAKVFFLSLGQGSPYNITVHPDVKGTISLSLHNTTVRNALEQVAKLYDYVWEEIPGGFQISPAQLTTAIYPLDYLYLTRTGNSTLSVGSGASSSSSGGSGSTGAGSSTVSSTSTQDIWGEVKTTLSALIGAGGTGGASVNLSPQTGLVIVNAMPKDLRKVEQYLRAAQKSVNKQVIIEAKILEVQLSDTSQYGINWSLLPNQLAGTGISLAKTGQGVDSKVFNGGGISFAVNNVNPALGISTAFNGIISAISTQGTVQVLSSPRVSAMNNQKAIMKVGKTSYYVVGATSSTTTTGTGAATTAASGPPVSQFFEGISLDVTPYIDQNNMVTLHVHPTITLITNKLLDVSSSTTAQKFNFPDIDARESDSIVRTRDNQIIVIGGLMTTSIESTHYGNGIKDMSNAKVKSELVILLRARVVDDNSMIDEMNASKARFNGLIKGIEKGK